MAEVVKEFGPPWPRVIAVVLALGGSFWGAYLLLVIGPAALFPIPFGVGYAITAGYIVRAAITPSFGLRRLIWGASILVQGAWLCLSVRDIGRSGTSVAIAWWAFATAASVVALAIERRPAARTCH